MIANVENFCNELNARGVAWQEINLMMGDVTRAIQWKDSTGRYVTAIFDEEESTEYAFDFFWKPTIEQMLDATLGGSK